MADNTATEPTLADAIAAVKRATEQVENWAAIWSGALKVGAEAELAALRVALAHLEAARWRPIAEAPENESVLIFIPHAEHYGPGIYRGMLVNMGTGAHWDSNAVSMGRSLGPDRAPTHFRPLPPPPAQEE